MAEKSTWIKIDRKILKWEWYKDNNTKALFLHLLLKANIKDSRFRGVEVKRGQLITSYAHLANETGMSTKTIRTALDHLKITGEISHYPYHDYSLISIEKFDYYQDPKTWQNKGKPIRLTNCEQGKNWASGSASQRASQQNSENRYNSTETYNKTQSEGQANWQPNGQARGKPRASKGQQSKNIKKERIEKEYIRSREEPEFEDTAWEDELGVPEQFKGRFADADDWLEFRSKAL